MAKKQTNPKNTGKSKVPQTSLVNTNTFLKGMIKDTDASYFNKENWFHARNAVNNSIDGDVGVIGNEPANQRCAQISYAIIGAIHLYGDTWVVFSSNNILSEIGLFDDSKCEYTIVINDPCLNFTQEHLITGVAKENFDCTWQVYWDDGNNPSRTLNINDVPYKTKDVTPPGATCIETEILIPNQLDCEKIRLAPLLDSPCIKLSKADSGGLLENGSYQVYVAYTINDKAVTDYIGISNIQSIWSQEDTQGSITINLSNLDKKFDWITVAIRMRVKGQPINKILGVYSTESNQINIDYINPELPNLLSSDLQRRNPSYEKSDGIFVVNDYLIRTQPTEQFDFNYQPLANQIQTFWTTTSFLSNYYKEGGNKTTLLRDEQYSFFIRFIYNTGEKSSSYHIPGRAPEGNELDTTASPNLIDPDDRVFKSENTASSTPTDPFIANMLNTTTDDGGIIIDGGRMGYWESTEIYPPNDATRWADLCGKPIRHHKMPDESVHSNGTSLTSQISDFEGDRINVIGVAFNNIPIPLYNDGSVIENIVGYEIMVGSRAGHRSIIAKGIVKNMFKFAKDKDDDDKSGLMPNYPYNDLRNDPFLLLRNTGSYPENWVTQIGNYGSVTPESNWLRGNSGNPSDSRAIPATDISLDTYTFHSPELNFSRLYLNPNEIRLYKQIQAEVVGRFRRSEDHPKNKLLKNRAATIAALIGVGYALAEMRGKRNNSIESFQSSTGGQFGGYVAATGSQVDAMPGAGTSTALANAGAATPGLFAGTVADLVFNTAVDIGAIFGGGKLARQIGTPLYQLAETASAGVAAGHIGPKRTLEVTGTDFTSVPSLMSIAIGVISFLNYIAVGGDKIIDLILNLMSFQDHAYKYVSHGYYKKELFLNDNAPIRQGINRARYIKQAIQSFDGKEIVQNVLRPSTVVVKTTNGWKQSWPPGDNSKFTIGNGPCAGNSSSGSMSYWDPTAEVISTAVTNYASFKTNIDNQYGQIDQIIQLNTQGCFNFASQQITDNDGDLVPFSAGDVFSTNTVYAGDSYICRYTEKTIMPFFYNFLKEGPDGIAFDYSKYANVPFPRFWMNTEKFRMDEFIRPITNLDFNWSDSHEALPSAYYNLDTPDSGGYCGGVTIPNMGEGDMAGSVLGDGNSGGMNSGGNASIPTGGGGSFLDPSMFDDSTNALNVAPVPVNQRPINNRYQILGPFSCSTGGVNFDINVTGSSNKYTVTGGLDSLSFSNNAPGSPTWATSVAAISIAPFVNFNTIQGFGTPLFTQNALNSFVTNSGNPLDGTWKKFLRGSNSNPVPSSYGHTGQINGVKVLYDWKTGTILNTVNSGAVVGTMYANGATLPSGKTSVQFQSDPDSNIYDGFINTVNVLSQGVFRTNNGSGSSNQLITTSASKILSGGGPGDPDALTEQLQDNFAASPYNASNNGTDTKTGGLFVVKTGFMYTHNCGINDFWVESSMNLSYRGYEDSPRKRHYDDEDFTDLVTLFHSKEIEFDNYYSYDRSTSVDKFWGSSWGEIQKRYYNPEISETCFTKYPKRLLYSAPATGWKDKAGLQSKNDQAQDFWRVYLKENFRDFKSKVTTVKPVNETGAMIFFPTLSPKVFQGSDRLQLSNTKITIGDGGLFSQAFQNVANSDVSHEYGSCESARSVLNTPFGLFFVSQAQGKIFQSSGKGIQPISDRGMKWWFNKYLPSKLLEYFPTIEDCPQAVDNPLVAAGVTTVFDPNNDIVYFTKKDFIPTDFYLNSKCLEYIPCEGFVYNASVCDNLPMIAKCPDGYTYDPDKEICTLTTSDEALLTPGTNDYYCTDDNCILSGSLCICTYEVEPEFLPVTFPIELSNTTYFKEISWTISYDPKSKAWISFHDWHPELTFNSISHFLSSKTETTNVPQCPPGFTFDLTSGECCQAFHEEFAAEVFVDEFISNDVITSATVNAFTETMDVALVIDNSCSTCTCGNCDLMDSQITFAKAFVNGMAAGMLGGAYPGQVKIGHGKWGGDGDFAVIQALTNNPTNCLASLTGSGLGTNYPGNYGGTDYDSAVSVADAILSGSTAANRIVIFITDAQGGDNVGDPQDFAPNVVGGTGYPVTQCIGVFTDASNSEDACITYSGSLVGMITNTGIAAPHNIATCLTGGTPERNMYHVGTGITAGQPGHVDTVAASIVAAFTSCVCSQGVIDQSLNNNPCLPLPSPAPDCISCNCPDGYTLVGDCLNSDDLPVCRKLECECPPVFFNEDEIITQTGKCDDVTQWYNPGSGIGNPLYVNTDPLFCVYDYELCVPANYEIGYFWKHNVRTDLFNNYYDQSYPWEVDIIEQTGQQVTTLRSIEYQMEAYLYKNDGRDRFHDLDYNFDQAVIYNSEQVSGLMNLILEPKNNVQLSMLYPIVNPNSIDTLYSKEEQKYRFNQFWDVTNDRGEFTGSTNTIFNTDWDGYKRNLNSTNLNYNKPQQERKKFRHYYNHILLRKSSVAATTRKMLLKLENTKLNVSFR